MTHHFVLSYSPTRTVSIQLTLTELCFSVPLTASIAHHQDRLTLVTATGLILHRLRIRASTVTARHAVRGGTFCEANVPIVNVLHEVLLPNFVNRNEVIDVVRVAEIRGRNPLSKPLISHSVQDTDKLIINGEVVAANETRIRRQGVLNSLCQHLQFFVMCT